MSSVDLTAMLALSGGIFCAGLLGVLARRTILFQLVALELMLAGPALAFAAGGAYHGGAEGQAMVLLVVTLAAAEVAVGLALFLRLRRLGSGTDSDAARKLRR